MRKIAVYTLVIALSLVSGLISTQGLLAQDEMGAQDKGAWTLGMPSMTDFKGSEPVETLEGKITKVEKMAGVRDSIQLRFILKDDNEKYIVLLGPRWFITNQKVNFAVGDRIEVRGKKVGNYIIAAQVHSGDWTLKLRNEDDGLPAWKARFPRNKK